VREADDRRQPADGRGARRAGGHDDVVAVGRVDDDLVLRAVARRPADGPGQVGVDRREVSAGDVVDRQPVGAAERVEVDPLDVVEVHGDVRHVAQEAHAPAVGRHVEGLGDVRPVERHRVVPVLALDDVAAVAGVPGEAVVVGAHERRVVALVAVDRVVVVAAEQHVVAPAAEQRVVADAAVLGELEHPGAQPAGVDAVLPAAAVDGERVAGRLGAPEVERPRPAGDRGAPGRARDRDRVVAVGGVDDRGVGRTVVREVAVDRAHAGPGEVIDREGVLPAAGREVDPLDAVDVHPDVADVSRQPRAGPVGRQPEALVRPAAVEGHRVIAAAALDLVAAVARVPDEAIVATAQVGSVVAPVAVDGVVAAVAVELLVASAAADRVVAAFAVDPRRDGGGEGTVGVVDTDLVVASAALDADAVDLVAGDHEVGAAVVADVDVDLVGSTRVQAQGQPVAGPRALRDQGPALEADGGRRVGLRRGQSEHAGDEAGGECAADEAAG
jgi:hypothetical protein